MTGSMSRTQANGSVASFSGVGDGRGGEPPLNIHAREDETFHVLHGGATFQRGMERIDVGPGEAILLPRGIQVTGPSID